MLAERTVGERHTERQFLVCLLWTYGAVLETNEQRDFSDLHYQHAAGRKLRMRVLCGRATSKSQSSSSIIPIQTNCSRCSNTPYSRRARHLAQRSHNHQDALAGGTRAATKSELISILKSSTCAFYMNGKHSALALSLLKGEQRDVHVRERHQKSLIGCLKCDISCWVRWQTQSQLIRAYLHFTLSIISALLSRWAMIMF